MLTAEYVQTVKVKHAKNTTDSSKVWFDYWLESTNINKFEYNTWQCQCCKTIVPISDIVGAHVIKADGSDDTMYIFPTCDTCNKTYKGDKADKKEFSVPITELIPIS